MTEVRREPCSSCPYRRDVPSGVWSAHEYDKLVDYDAPTGAQPMAVFACHATPEHYCHGWAVCHSTRGHEFDLLALRIAAFRSGPVEIPEPAVPLFGSGAEAAAHGKADLDDPSEQAVDTMGRLLRKYERLRRADP